MLIAAIFLGTALFPSTAFAAHPADVLLVAPGGFLGGFGFAPEIGGTWYQESRIEGGQLVAELTLQLPAAARKAGLGPIVVLWQLRVTVADKDFGDSSSILVAPPQAVAVLPNCDSAQNCALRVRLNGPIAPALEATDLDWATEPTLAVAFNVIRTYESGSVVQVAEPYIVADADGGTLARPGGTYGALNQTPTFSIDDATLAEIPGQAFRGGDVVMYDWAGAVRDALATFVPPESPEPVPIHVWTPERTGVRHVQVRATYSAPCPLDRVVIMSNLASGEIMAVVYVGGHATLTTDLALRTDVAWLLSLRNLTGETFSTTQIPAGANDVLVSGNEDCVDGKGALDVSGLPLTIPSPYGSQPESTPSQSARPSDDTRVDPVAPWIGGVLASALAALAALLLWRRGRKRNPG